MLNKSDSNVFSSPLEQPSSGLNPAAQIMTQPVQLVQTVPVFHPLYQQGVPMVLSQIPRMPVTMLPPPMTVSCQPTTAESTFYHPVSNYRTENFNGYDSLCTTVAFEIYCLVYCMPLILFSAVSVSTAVSVVVIIRLHCSIS